MTEDIALSLAMETGNRSVRERSEFSWPTWPYDGNCGNRQIISEYIEYRLYREKMLTGLIKNVRWQGHRRRTSDGTTLNLTHPSYDTLAMTCMVVI